MPSNVLAVSKHRKSNLHCVAVASLLISTSLFVSSCSRAPVDTSEVVRPVRVIELKSGANSAEETFPAQIEPRVSADLSFQVGGKLIRRLVDVGAVVKKGQILAEIDPKDLKLAQQAAQAQLDAANTEFNQNKIDLERAKTLRAQNFISQVELDRRQLAFDAANSRLSQAKAQFDVQRNQSQYASLRAPDNGVVAAVYAEAGQVVGPGQAVLKWADGKKIQAKFFVPESRITDYKDGMKAKIALWSEDKKMDGVIREVAPIADAVTRTYPVYLDVIGPHSDLRFGMSATVSFTKDRPDSGYKLPISALVAEHQGAFVWIFDEQNGTVNKRAVMPHDISESSFLVKEGLKGGELVVTAGTHVLTEGQKARRFIEVNDVINTPKPEQKTEQDTPPKPALAADSQTAR